MDSLSFFIYLADPTEEKNDPAPSRWRRTALGIRSQISRIRIQALRDEDLVSEKQNNDPTPSETQNIRSLKSRDPDPVAE